MQGNKDNGTIDQALFPFGIRDNDVIGSEGVNKCGARTPPRTCVLTLTLDKAKQSKHDGVTAEQSSCPSAKRDKISQ
jgi:hypothetical protein